MVLLLLVVAPAVDAFSRQDEAMKPVRGRRRRYKLQTYWSFLSLSSEELSLKSADAAADREIALRLLLRHPCRILRHHYCCGGAARREIMKGGGCHCQCLSFAIVDVDGRSFTYWTYLQHS